MIEDEGKEISELEYIESLMEDFELTPADTLGDLIEALRDEEALETEN